MFIAIIEEAYIASKMHNKNHWIYSYLNIDNLSSQDKQKSEENTKKEAEKKPNNFAKKFMERISKSLQKSNSLGNLPINEIEENDNDCSPFPQNIESYNEARRTSNSKIDEYIEKNYTKVNTKLN